MPKIERKYLAHFLDAKFGVQIPFTVYNAGNRVKGTFDLTTKTFTADTNAAPGNSRRSSERGGPA